MTSNQLAGSPEIGNSIGIVLMPIPASEFRMDSSESEEFRQDDEMSHLVKLTKPFHLRQWKALMGTTPWKDRGGLSRGDSCPAVWVGWKDVVKFCRKLSKKEGVEYRLPTETRWKYACRAETTMRYSFGGDQSQMGVYAWYDEPGTRHGIEKHAPKVVKKNNVSSRHDMYDNVAARSANRSCTFPGVRLSAVIGFCAARTIP